MKRKYKFKHKSSRNVIVLIYILMYQFNNSTLCEICYLIKMKCTSRGTVAITWFNRSVF